MCTRKEFLREILDILVNIDHRLVFSRMVQDKMGIKSKAGPGNSILNTEVFDITSKVNVHFNCYSHT